MWTLLSWNHHLKAWHSFISFRFQDELMRVPLPGIVAILSSNHPGIASQGAVYDFVLRWADSHYPNSEERRKILSSRLLPLVPQECSKTNANLIDQPSCIVDFILKREQFSGLYLYPSGSIRSPPFYCAGHGFFLSVQCVMELSGLIFVFLIKKTSGQRGVQWCLRQRECLRWSLSECGPGTCAPPPPVVQIFLDSRLLCRR
jgi:hypothetical protein